MSLVTGHSDVCTKVWLTCLYLSKNALESPCVCLPFLVDANLCLRFVFFVFRCFSASAWHRKPPQVYSSIVYTPRGHGKTSSHSYPQKQSLGLRHNKALACIPPARSWLLLRVMASRAREGCQPVRQTVLFLVLLQKMSTSDTLLVASRKHRSHPRSLQAPPVPARASLS